jgi:carboxyl-terminal processing protease
MKMLNKVTQRNTLRLVTASVLSVLLAACGDSNSLTVAATPPPVVTPPPVAVAKDVQASTLTGVWAQRGYGRLVEITDSLASVYQYDQSTCLLEEELTPAELDEYFVQVVLAADKQSFDSKPEHGPTDVHAYTAHKMAELPQACEGGGIVATDDPLTNYDVLWHSFNDYYAFFGLRGIDWQAIDVEFRAKVADIADNNALLQLFIEMLEPLNDGHLNMKLADGTPIWYGGGPSLGEQRKVDFFIANNDLEQLQQDFEQQDEFEDFDAFLTQLYMAYYEQLDDKNVENILSHVDDAQCGGDEGICWGITPDNVGYLLVDQMMGFDELAEESDPAQDMEIVKAVLNEAMPQLADTKAMIVDVRRNQGGYDKISLEIAGRFTTTEQMVYRKKVAYQGGFANHHDVMVTPTGDSQYAKPVYLLTSNGTYSAAETFAVAMKGFEHVTLVGESTGGILSDQITKILPMGVQVTMSSEVYTDSQGNVYEGVGVPVEHQVDYMVPTEVLDGHDTGIEKALSLINGL